LFSSNIVAFAFAQTWLNRSVLSYNGVELIISPQILREYLVGTTRPMPDGSHVPLADALANATAFRAEFRLLDENGSVAAALIIQLEQVSAIGRQIPDANIVATMRAYGVRRLLTNNPDDFARYAHLITIFCNASSDL
jgi:predicted nucleic acid-binding protein